MTGAKCLLVTVMNRRCSLHEALWHGSIETAQFTPPFVFLCQFPVGSVRDPEREPEGCPERGTTLFLQMDRREGKKKG